MKILMFILACHFSLWAETDATIKKYLETVKSNPGDYATYNKIGLWYVTSGNYKEAAENFSKAITVNNNYFEGYFNLGLLYYQQNRTLDALTQFKRAFTLSKNPDLYTVIMNCFIKINNLDFASRYLEEALKNYKDNYKILNTAGIIELYRNNYAKAREYFTSALKFKEDNKIRNNLAIAEYHSGDKETAKQTLKSLKKELKLFNENFELISK